ncbi:MAG: FeoC-like transcriptional regulator [Thiohalocapsa sp.]
MILSELRDYLQQHRRASLVDIMNRFDTDADALRGMLGVLERKGRVRKLPPGAACDSSGCTQCCQAQATPESYELVKP